MNPDFAYKIFQAPTGVSDCTSGYITHLRSISSHPNLVITSSNVLELYTLRTSNTFELYTLRTSNTFAKLDLTYTTRLYDVVECVRVLRSQAPSKRDRIVVMYENARVSVFEFDDSLNKLVNSKFVDGGSVILLKPPIIFSQTTSHCRIRPLVRMDPLGRCGAVVIYGQSMMLMKIAEEGDTSNGVASVPGSVNYQIHRLNAKVKDFAFIDGSSEALLYTLHERHPTSAERMVSAFDVSATLKLKRRTSPFSFVPDDAYKLEAVPAPYGGVLILSSKSIVYYQSNKQKWFELGWNRIMIDFCTCIRPDLVLLSLKDGAQEILRLVPDGFTVKGLDCTDHFKQDVFSTSVATLGENFYFIGGRFSCVLRQYLWINISEKIVNYDDEDRDSWDTIGPLKDFDYLKEKKADGLSSYGIVCCSNYGKSNFLYKFYFYVRPEVLHQEQDPEDCTGLWTVYMMAGSPGEADQSQHHAFLVYSCEKYTQMIKIDDKFNGHAVGKTYNEKTIKAGSLSKRGYVVLVHRNGCRFFNGNGLETYVEAPATICTATIAYNYVLLLMEDGRIQLHNDDPVDSFSIINLDKIQDPDNLITSCTLFYDWGTTPWLENVGGSEVNMYLVLCHTKGTLQIYSLPHLHCIFTVDEFVCGRSCIGDSVADRLSPKDDRRVVELAMHRWYGENSRPFLFGILSDGDILCYHAFRYGQNLRFARVCFDYTKVSMSENTQIPRFQTFERVGPCEGLFLCGSSPTWFMKIRERFRIHPQLCDGSINAFAALLINGKHAFIYASQGALKVCELPSPVDYDHHWPVEKVDLHLNDDLNLDKIEFLEQPNLYLLTVSHAGQYGICRYNAENSECILYQAVDKACAVRRVELFDKITKDMNSFLAIGTVSQHGQGGQVVLYSPTKDFGHVSFLKMKGAVSALVSTMQGYLLVASGTELLLYELRNSWLHLVAKYGEIPFCILNMHKVTTTTQDNTQEVHRRELLLITDIHKGVYLVRVTETEAPELEILDHSFGGRLYLSSGVLGLDHACIVVSNDQKQVQAAGVCNETSSLLGGADWFYVGAHVMKFLEVFMPNIDDKRSRMGSLFCTEEGSIGCLAPLSKSLSDKVRSLQIKILADIPYISGPDLSLDEDDQNSYHWGPLKNKMIDLEVLSQYIMLPFERQAELAQCMGMTPAEVISVLDDIVLDPRFL